MKHRDAAHARGNFFMRWWLVAGTVLGMMALLAFHIAKGELSAEPLMTRSGPTFRATQFPHFSSEKAGPGCPQFPQKALLARWEERRSLARDARFQGEGQHRSLWLGHLKGWDVVFIPCEGTQARIRQVSP